MYTIIHYTLLARNRNNIQSLCTTVTYNTHSSTAVVSNTRAQLQSVQDAGCGWGWGCCGWLIRCRCHWPQLVHWVTSGRLSFASMC